MTDSFIYRDLAYAFAAALFGLGLTQIGEFSYVLVKVAHDNKLVGADVYGATLAASLFTILLNAALIQFVPLLMGQMMKEAGQS